MICLLALLQIAIHEAGHLFFGLITGYQFVAYRILSLTLIKIDGSLRLRYTPKEASLGQCIMSPHRFSEDAYPYALHILGGIIFNIFSGLVFLAIALGVARISFSIRIFFLLGAFYGIGFAIINSIPNRRGSINNDGLNYYSIKRDRQALISNYRQATILTLLLEGKEYKDIPEELIKVPIGADMLNPLIGWHKLLECYYYIDLRHWREASECISAFTPVMKNINKALCNAVIAESIFLSSVSE